MEKESELGLAKYDKGNLEVLGVLPVILFPTFVKKLLNSFAILPGS